MTPIITAFTSNWQLYFPEAIRNAMNLTHPTQVEISVVKGGVFVKPKKSKILEAAGMFAGSKPIKPVDIDNVRDYIDYGNW